jgi:hypothetical protein
MYVMLEQYYIYEKGQSLVVIDEGPDWVRTNRGIYVFKNLIRGMDNEDNS